ncbi:succinate dehydrogenase iron-sulfur subunit [Archaeoglobales archaeon ex4484_92]|nr:MAG: succinate dehydrogenase iron-sulfur subunit [Archaeoglobales archaeon ex4484_92]
MVEFRIRRFNGDETYWESFEVPTRRGMTVLEGLYYIKENIDSSLTFRASCRMGICGSCAVKINGRPKLACETQISSVGNRIVLEPLDNFTVLKDLVTEFEGFFAKHKAVKPYLIRSDISYEEPKELIQTPSELRNYYIFTLCIKCGACYSVCPAAATRDDCLGPAAMMAAYRFCADSRDKGEDARISIASKDLAVWRCHLAMECSEVCPKKAEPAKAIQLLRRKTAVNAIKSILRW